MNVIPAWKEGVTGKGIVVTILDDGLESDHPDLIDNFVSCSLFAYHFFFQLRHETFYGFFLKFYPHYVPVFFLF